MTPFVIKDTPDGLLVGGYREIAAGETQSVFLEQWANGGWTTLVDGPNCTCGLSVQALESYAGELVAGGYFPALGSTPLGNTGAWDGSRWRPLADGFAGPVSALIVHDGELVAGGNLEGGGPGDRPKIGAMRWDGTEWRSMGNVGGTVLSLGTWNGTLIASGSSTTCRTHSILF